MLHSIEKKIDNIYQTIDTLEELKEDYKEICKKTLEKLDDIKLYLIYSTFRK